MKSWRDSSKKGPTAEELAARQAQYQANFIRGIERIGGFGGKSDRLAQSQVFRGSPDAYKISLKRVQEATAEDLRAAAQTLAFGRRVTSSKWILSRVQDGGRRRGPQQSSRIPARRLS